MQIEGEVNFKAPVESVWNALLDPEAIAACVPGCRELKQTDSDTYTAVLKVGVGAVSGTYEGELRIAEKEPPSRFVMIFEGAGAQGFAKGHGEAKLRADDGSTVVSYCCEVEVGGLIASVGQRALEGVGKFLIKGMFAKLESHVAKGGHQ